MGTPIISAATMHWMRTISLRTQPECQEENSVARNRAGPWEDHSHGRRNAPFSSFLIRPHGISMQRHWIAAFVHRVFLPYHWSERQPPLGLYSAAKPVHSEVWRWPRTVRISTREHSIF